MIEGHVVKALVRAVFACTRCGQPAEVLASCPVGGNMLLPPAERPPEPVLCAACRRRAWTGRRRVRAWRPKLAT